MSSLSNVATTVDAAASEPQQVAGPQVQFLSQVERVNKNNDKANPELQTILMLNTAYYIAVFILIGVPVWFLTTTTYRAALPVDEIDRIASTRQFKMQINFQLISFEKDISSSRLASLEKHFLAPLFKSSEDSQSALSFDFKARARKFRASEREAALRATKLEELDELLATDSSSHQLTELCIYFLDAELANHFAFGSSHEFIFLDNLYLNEPNSSDASFLSRLTTMLLDNYLNTRKLSETFSRKLGIGRKINATFIGKFCRSLCTKPSKDDLRVVNFDSEYEIIFSLINEKPLHDQYNWNIDECIAKYFRKIVDQLSAYTNFSLKAQTLLYSEFESYPVATAKASSSSSSYFYVKPSDLSIMTNSIESRLGSRISDSSALEFVLYVPAKQPLFIVASSDSTTTTQQQTPKTSSFLVPRWGGVYIYNQNFADNADSSIRANDAVKIFLTQFIDLVGVRLNKNSRQISRSKLFSSEIYGYLLTKTLENQLDSINTLKSLSSLLTRISSMVIEDDIAKQIHLSVEAVSKSIEFLQSGNILDAFAYSKTAFISSEKAFFDPSLLEKLYFPEDQRFAVYIPLFIPVGLPLILSLKALISWMKKNKKTTGTETETEARLEDSKTK